jgi:hypothetical protein
MKQIEQAAGVFLLAGIIFLAFAYGSADAAEAGRICAFEPEWRARLLAILMVAMGGVGFGASLALHASFRNGAKAR